MNKKLAKIINWLRWLAPRPLLNGYHFFVAWLGALRAGFPSKRIKVIGVTGTNGKSTVVYLLSRVLERAGYPTAAFSSIEIKIREKTRPNALKMTMPGRGRLQKFLKQAVEAGCQYAVLEVTSEGIKQYRHKFIRFASAIFTNLSWEHIESHGGFENYKKAKGELFKALKGRGKVIVNLDDHQADYFLSFPAEEKYGYGLINQNEPEDLKPSSYQIKPEGLEFVVKNEEFKVSLLAKFNLYNLLAVIAATLAEEIPLLVIKDALARVKNIPGRLEVVAQKPFRVIVDYAHTPDALGKLYQNLRHIFKSRIVGVTGAAGGGRDKWKRPILGKVACYYCDKVIITNEDPYDESPLQIIEEVAKGCQTKVPEKILDRRQAIQRAFRLARPGDLVVITGKGCEPWICIAHNQKMAWDDRQVVREELAKLEKSKDY